MIGYRPVPYMKYCWRFITPCAATVSKVVFCSSKLHWYKLHCRICIHTERCTQFLDSFVITITNFHSHGFIYVVINAQGTLFFALVKFTSLKYNNAYQYPWWGQALGLCLGLSSVLMVPLWCLYRLAVTPGTLRQVL